MNFFLIGQLVYTILISLYIAFYKKAKASLRVKLIGFVIGTYILFLLKVTDIYGIELTIKNILIINIAILFISEVFLRLSRFKIELKQRKEERRNQLQEIHDKQKAEEE